MKPMRERNQVTVAVVGTALVAALVLLTMNLGKVPFLHPKTTYHAQFANADGLKAGDDVRVEGVSVGSVSMVRVEGDHVRVDFTVRKGLALGSQSRASIEMATILGNLFLQVESAGPGRLRSGGTIPLALTTVPYTVIDALGQVGTFGGGADLPRLRQSLQTLAGTVSGISAKDAKVALDGLGSVASTVGAQQRQIADLLQAADTVVGTLNQHSQPLVELLVQGDQFLKLLQQRRQVVNQLLTDTARLGAELARLVTTNQAQLAPLLANLDAVGGVLARQKTQLQHAIEVLARFSGNIADATGTGPWIDLLSPTVLLPNNVVASCGQQPATSNGPCG